MAAGLSAMKPEDTRIGNFRLNTLDSSSRVQNQSRG